MKTILPEELSAWLQQHYHLTEQPVISLLRSYTNDVYRIISSGEKYVLKVYGVSWRSEEEIRYEIELLCHLDKEGLAVAKPIPGREKEIVQQVATDQGVWHAVLYEYAAGVKPEPPFSNQLYFLFGETIGKMHALSNNFISSCQRKRIDLDFLIDQPFQVILPIIKDRSQVSAYLQNLGDKIKRRMIELNQRGLDWGPIHGDATLDNLHVDENGRLILYDFDSGGPGWRASDLQGWAIGHANYKDQYDAFINGYRHVRKLLDQDVEASGYMTLAWDIWGMKIDLENRILIQGRDVANRYLSEQVRRLQDREKFLVPI